MSDPRRPADRTVDGPIRSSGVLDGIGRRLRSPPWLARAAGVGLCTVSLALVGAFVGAVWSGGLAAFLLGPPAMRVTVLLSPLVVPLAIGTAAGAVAGWYHGYWSRAVRLHQTVLALLGLGFVWKLTALGLLG